MTYREVWHILESVIVYTKWGRQAPEHPSGECFDGQLYCSEESRSTPNEQYKVRRIAGDRARDTAKIHKHIRSDRVNWGCRLGYRKEGSGALQQHETKICSRESHVPKAFTHISTGVVYASPGVVNIPPCVLNN